MSRLALVLVLVSGITVSAVASPDSLPRRLDFGWVLETPGDSGAMVKRLQARGAAERAGVRIGDRILRAGNSSLNNDADLSALRFAGPVGKALPLELSRSSQLVHLKIRPAAAPSESHPGIATELSSIAGPNNLRIRTLLTIPAGAAPHPTVFIVGWLSCDSVEIPAEYADATALLMQDVIEHSGSAVYRIDKPGSGDSQGVCSATDFTTEFEAYQRAFAALRADRRLDPKRIVIMGISNGGGVAPLLVNGEQPAGYVTIDGWSKTWFEHMLDLERRRLVLSHTPLDRIDSAMAGFSAFYSKYLLEQMTPGEVLRQRPDLRTLWYDKDDSQYGRPTAFYQQLQRLDLAAAWGRVRVPSLIVWGEYDWIMDKSDQQQMVALVNADGVERATLLIVPGADHNFGRHLDAQVAFDHGGDGSYPAEAGQRVVDFIRRVSSLSAQ